MAKIPYGVPSVTVFTCPILIIIGLVAEACTAHKGFYLLKLTIMSIVLGISPGHFQLIVY
jgi:hypothetical protein